MTQRRGWTRLNQATVGVAGLLGIFDGVEGSGPEAYCVSLRLHPTIAIPFYSSCTLPYTGLIKCF